MLDELHEDIIKKILQQDVAHLQVTCMIITSDEDMAKHRLLDILGTKDSMLTASGRKIYDLVESGEFLRRDLYLNFKWKVTAFITVQDTFDGALYSGDIKGIGLKNYFYYESLHLLREYIYCGFNNCLSAAQQLLRTILEFNIKQLYFERLCTTASSYQPVMKYLRDGICPSAPSMVHKILSDYKEAKPLQKSISRLYSQLSKTSSHAYAPIYSARSSGKMQHEYSMDSLLFWINLSMVLSQILWMYYFCHPQLFNPKDIVKKFGFNPPCGCYITDNQHASVKKSLRESDYKMFRDLALSSEKIASFNFMYDSSADLSQEEIEATWNQEDGAIPKDYNVTYYTILVQLRAIQEVTASSISFEVRHEIEKNIDINDKTLGTIDSYDWTTRHYKSM